MLESLQISAATPFGARPYEWVVARATYAVDPGSLANSCISDLQLVDPDGDGLVRFSGDVRVLRPVNGGNGRALVQLPNRGLVMGMPFAPDPLRPGRIGLDVEPPGDGFLLDHGWTIAWCGWQSDIPRTRSLLGLSAPVASVDPGFLRIEFRSDSPLVDHALSDSGQAFRFTDYPTVDVTDPEASLTARASPFGEKKEISRSAWEFSSSTRFTLGGGFRAFIWYELVYRSLFAPVVGCGLLALRDLGSFLHSQHEYVFATGQSQCGRVLRQFVYEGLNVDEQGRRVYDGIFASVAGARRGEFNQRFGQPALIHPMTRGYAPPYSSRGLLARQRLIGGVPKMMLTNSSWEYWRGDGALLHQDPVTGEDTAADPNVRIHLISGTDHFGPRLAVKEALPLANPPHGLSPLLVLRALFRQLEEWVCDGVQPVASQVPCHRDGTLVSREEVLCRFPCAARPDPTFLPWTPKIDPQDPCVPVRLGEPQVALVSDVDDRGNEIAGIRLPAVEAGLAVFTGWNPREPQPGLPDVLYEMAGSRIPRCGGSEPRRPEFMVRTAARALVDRRLLLPEDRDLAVEEALQT